MESEWDAGNSTDQHSLTHCFIYITAAAYETIQSSLLMARTSQLMAHVTKMQQKFQLCTHPLFPSISEYL
jgi:hypothetical protein